MSRTSSTQGILSFAFLLLVQLSMNNAVTAQSTCHICGTRGNQDIQFPDVVLQGVGKTCPAIALEVASSIKDDPDPDACASKQKEWSALCCSGTRPNGSDRPQGLPPQNIPSVQYVGPDPVCNLCRDGDYPYDTSMVINFLYIGEATCAQYYQYAKEGRIQKHMCDTVKFFAYEPCGCGEFNPYFNPNHPLAQTAQQAPQQNNNNGGNSSPSTSGQTMGSMNVQRTPDADDGKSDAKMGGEGRGGSAGGGRRFLKGSPVAASSSSENDLVEV